MDYARRQRDPTRHMLGIGFVVLLHALVIYALVTGLARKAVEVIKKPITATIIEEIKAPNGSARRPRSGSPTAASTRAAGSARPCGPAAP